MDLSKREQALLDEAKRTASGDQASPYLAVLTGLAVPVLLIVTFLVVAFIKGSRDWSSYLSLALMVLALASIVFPNIRREQTYRSLVRKLDDRQKEDL